MPLRWSAALSCEIITEVSRIGTPGGIDESCEAKDGGIRQVINVRGADRVNTILVFVHGGPAAVEMPIIPAFQRPWEDYSTVVQ